MTSAGTGIRHSEYNRNTQKQAHFLVRTPSHSSLAVQAAADFVVFDASCLSLLQQIWALPNKSHLPPTYYSRHVTDAEKREGLVRVVGPTGTEGVSEERETKGPAPVSCQLYLPPPSSLPSLPTLTPSPLFPQVHADLHLFATLLPASSTVHHIFQTPLKNPKSLRKAYIHVVSSSHLLSLSAKLSSDSPFSPFRIAGPNLRLQRERVSRIWGSSETERRARVGRGRRSLCHWWEGWDGVRVGERWEGRGGGSGVRYGRIGDYFGLAFSFFFLHSFTRSRTTLHLISSNAS